MKFKIITLGCKVNAYESEVIKEKLLSDNFEENNDTPDVVILNTCSVTNTADSKSLKTLRRIKRENPKSIFVVCGCSVQNNKESFENIGADIIIGNKEKSKIVDLIKDFIKNNKEYENVGDMQNTYFEDMQIDSFNHVRAYIKIQDGCNNYCSYCIIPYLRGNLRCKDFDTTLKEAKTLVENNHKEIVLTGIHTGSYNSNGNDLCDLIVALSEIKGLKRIRLSSIEITEINNEKFYELLKNNKVLCDHLHIPLQAGSDNVLKRMNRKYDLTYYESVIKNIRAIRPNISISTDCIVGHPYETEQNFLNTLEFCEKIKFSKIHVFPYSKREGTAASKMPEQVDEKTKKVRASKLIELSNKLEKDYANKFIGKSLEILVEEKEGDYAIGHTSNMIKVKQKNSASVNDLVNVVITEDNYE